MGFLRNITTFVVVFAVIVQILLQLNKEQTGKASRFTVVFSKDNSSTKFERTDDGTMQFWVDDRYEIARALGYSHAKDRFAQMFMLRTILQGRLTELLADSPETLNVDKYLRKVSLYHYAKETLPKLSESSRKFLDFYCEGVNQYLSDVTILPFEFVVAGFKPEPWQPADTIGILNIMGYLGLADTQQHAEKIIIQAAQDSQRSFDFFKRVYSPHLDEVDSSLFEILKKVKIEVHKVPPPVVERAPKLKASNNWVISSKLSETGNPILASDPHLNVLQLPSIWYEAIAHTPNNDYFGISVAGVPGIVMGRSRDLAFGFTYGFVDMIDYYIEQVRGEEYLLDGKWVPLTKRVETIRRKSGENVTVTLYSTANGILELSDSTVAPIPEGYYLSWSFGLFQEDSYHNLQVLHNLFDCKTVKEGQEVMKKAELATNMLFADKEGNIGYQQSGYAPDRPHSGLYPLPGWESKNKWKGRVSYDNLTSYYNPDEGYIVTANNFIHDPKKHPAVTLHMGTYRTQRIEDLLKQREKHTVENFKEMQGDVYAIQAEKYFTTIRPVLNKLPDSAVKSLLSNWDYRYNRESQAVVLFEKFYELLMKEILGRVFINQNAQDIHLYILGPFFSSFDNLIYEPIESDKDLIWYNTTLEKTVENILLQVFEIYPTPESVPTWGKLRETYMPNMFFGGKLGAVGKFLGIDYGPVSLAGGRSTINQGQQWVEPDGRVGSFAPSWRFVTDVGSNVVDSVLPGGISGRWASGLYTSQIKMWLDNQYKKLKLN